MKKLFSACLGIFILIFAIEITAKNIPPVLKSLANSQQLIIVVAENWNAPQGQLQRYQRDNKKPWRKIGSPIAVHVGKNGMGWEVSLRTSQFPGPRKKEGDSRSPAGIFTLGNAFGFASSAHFNLPYKPITPTTVCVDDINSHYYNQIVDSSKVKMDWHNGEQMDQEAGYKFGAVVNYNMPNPQRGAGSCIFLHIWQTPTHSGTSGCVAMDEKNVISILKWLDPTKKPMIVILPKPLYKELYKDWHLPSL